MDISKIKFEPFDLESLPKSEYFGLTYCCPEQVYGPMEDTDLSMRFLRYWILNLQKSPTPEKPIRILEIGCGSGILSLYLISRLLTLKFPFYHFGSDINPLAVQTANFNAQLNHLETQVHFESGEFFDALRTSAQRTPYDLIVFNPPYLANEPETINSQNRQMIDLAWEIKKSTDIPVIIMPNAGLPETIKDNAVFYPEDEIFFADSIKKIKGFGVEIVGGCCGTTPGYIKKIKEII